MARLTVNGQPIEYRMDPATPLLFALREASNLTGTKNGCATGHCGACTVHVDGRAVRSCQAKIGELEGSLVTTIEGLAQNRSHPIQQAFLANNVVQCGFCVPGMIMAIAALIDRGERPGEAEVDAAITNICRCGIYPRLREAIRGAMAARPGSPADAPPSPATGEQPPAPAAEGALPDAPDPAPPELEGPEMVPE
jgi:isoquinoline 1-oxidoreductase alpha subunit